jgi:hypothetical protein
MSGASLPATDGRLPPGRVLPRRAPRHLHDPEMALGQTNLAAQSVQFSPGLVLYELASGKGARFGDSAAETVWRFIREDPEPLFCNLTH